MQGELFTVRSQVISEVFTSGLRRHIYTLKQTMTTIFVDQENSDSVNLSKDHLWLPSSSSKGLSLKGKVGCPRKVFHPSDNVTRPSRKALGNVNQQVATCNTTQIDVLKQRHLSISKKTSEVKCTSVPLEEAFPDIENFFPYNPCDFDSFAVPENQKLSNICLAGVGLMVNNDLARFEELTDFYPSPMEVPELHWNSDAADSLQSFLTTFNEISLDMPDELF